MNYLLKWKEISSRNLFLHSLDIILKGYSQVLICLNPLTGLLFSITIFYLSKQIWLLTFLGLVVSTLTGALLRPRPIHINSGVYGFNGVIFGLAWLWFFKLNIISVFLLIIAVSLSSILMKLFTDVSSKTKANPPILSIPFVILMWVFIFAASYLAKDICGKSREIVGYTKILNENFYMAMNSPSLAAFFLTFKKHIIALTLIFLSVLVSSRISAFFVIFSTVLTLFMVFFLEGLSAIEWSEFYLYNTLPCGLALGGIFLVFNRKAFFYTTLAMILILWICFIFYKLLPGIPMLVLPFNAITIIFISLARAGILTRKYGFFAVPLDFVSTPEMAIRWQKGEVYADTYWKDIKKFCPPSQKTPCVNTELNA